MTTLLEKTILFSAVFEKIAKKSEIDVPLVKQTTGYCGPASLKAVLEHWGTEKSEKALADLMGSSRKKGTPGDNIVEGAKELGFNAEIKDDSTWEDLEKVVNRKIPVIVNWWDETEGHYSVVTKINHDNLTIMDPYTKSNRTFEKKEFIPIWFDFDSRNPNPYPDPEWLITRRMIIITPKS